MKYLKYIIPTVLALGVSVAFAAPPGTNYLLYWTGTIFSSTNSPTVNSMQVSSSTNKVNMLFDSGGNFNMKQTDNSTFLVVDNGGGMEIGQDSGDLTFSSGGDWYLENDDGISIGTLGNNDGLKLNADTYSFVNNNDDTLSLAMDSTGNLLGYHNISAQNFTATSTATSTLAGPINGQEGYVQHCTTIVSAGYNGTSATSTTVTSGGNPANHRVALNTVLSDPDGMANVVSSLITVPAWANNVQVSGHIDYPSQTSSTDAIAAVHLFRSNGSTNEAFYHVETYYASSSNSVNIKGIYAASPVIPVRARNEYWTLNAFQNTGTTVTIGGDNSDWLSVCFYP